MERKIRTCLREAEKQINNAKFVVGCGVGDCMMYERLKAMSDELLDMINSLER